MDHEVIHDLISGWASGALSVMCCQPLDTILTRLQANVGAPPKLVPSSSLFCLWKGSSALIGAIPIQNALLMAGYGLGKRWVVEEDGKTQPNELLAGVFVGGCVGGVLQSFLMSPVELVKVNQQVNGKSLSSAVLSVSYGMFSKPLRGWRGLEATLMRDGLPHGVWFATYEFTKTKIETETRIEKTSPVIPLFSGAVAALIAWGVGYPFDIIKTRIQSASTTNVSRTPQMIDVAKDIMKESNGQVLQGLYKGFGLKLAKAIPASAINFFVYEKVMSSLA
mmetsp:Transcript_20916/g.24061  ORF Transcript_20916/g.24061 Transcript_20916/m.24061 type:complete len:279 (+) Transcript_20916:77-913(+)|eukprot:CAMPEP_0194375064 /NCGR_PEP_ID=MMETSP0174-20130528/23521_1 /TAXON_ID=216777 /ORGANISM="Proboscia alata, Strain PI-D3" /LENGTH=278 /DNA_ID=CAMNT_0039155011 /DNA_START=158 /DNA_END=994 /DNA_ORIENTATION=+